MSRYTRLGPMPLVLVIDLETGLSLGGSLAAFRGGRAGFATADEKPIDSGTVKPKDAKKGGGKKKKTEQSTLELTTG